jgi:hypothetical protein
VIGAVGLAINAAANDGTPGISRIVNALLPDLWRMV